MKRGVGFIAREAVDQERAPDRHVEGARARRRVNGGDAVPTSDSRQAADCAVSRQSAPRSYLVACHVRLEATRLESLQSYYATRFFRFLVSLRKITQDATHSTYTPGCRCRRGTARGQTRSSTRSTASREKSIAFIESHGPTDELDSGDDE